MHKPTQQDLGLLQYLLDLQGYLVIENALSPDEVATLNQLIDAQKLPPPGKTQRFGSAPEGAGFLDWGKPLDAADQLPYNGYNISNLPKGCARTTLTVYCPIFSTGPEAHDPPS